MRSCIFLRKLKGTALFAVAFFLTITAFPGEVNVGDKAPSFTGVDQYEKPWTLQDHLGGPYLVLYFYPAAMTGGCTKQAGFYRDYIDKTADIPFRVIGISGDTPQSLTYFQEAEGLNFTLLSDSAGTIAEAFGVPIKTGDRSITRTIDGRDVTLSRTCTPSRSTFIIDPSGMVVYKNLSVNPAQDLRNILEFLNSTAVQTAP